MGRSTKLTAVRRDLGMCKGKITELLETSDRIKESEPVTAMIHEAGCAESHGTTVTRRVDESTLPDVIGSMTGGLPIF